MQLVLKILIWALGLAAVAALALVLSVVVDAAQDGNRLEGVANTRVSPEVRAFVAKPNGAGPFPAVIMIHEFWGLKPEIADKAKLLSEQGYLVIAPDTYRNQRTDWLPRAIFLSATTPTERVNQDLDAVYAWLRAQPEVDQGRIAVMGFCYGGTASLNYSLHNPRLTTTAIFYGQVIGDVETLRRLPGPVLGIFGEQDAMIPLEEVRAFEAGLNSANIPNEITVYPGQGHAFVQNVDGIKAGGAQGQAWAQLLSFLERNLKNATVAQLRPALQTGGHIHYGNPAPRNWLTAVVSHMGHEHQH